MNYLSASFQIFVVITLVLYYLFPMRKRQWVLLAASLFFYISFDVRYLLFLLFVSGSTFWCAKTLNKTCRKKLLLVVCILVNFLMWFCIKELSWLINSILRALGFSGGTFAVPAWFQLVPIGISYYTLQAIAYIVDVYKGKIVTEQKFWRYLLFLSYFPAIVQGPISRYDELAPQLCNTNKFDPTRFQDGLTLVLLGLVKKIVVADRLAIFVNNCFTNYETFHGMVLYVGAVCYAFQLYMDFSGCVDICRGVSGMFGISLVENFKSPYYAKSTKEFWNRWHLSLSRWLKDYVYIPLGGNRHGRMRKYVNLIITFGVSGMWHGAGFNYIVWGVLQAVYQIVGEITSNFRSKFKARIGVKLGSASDIAYSTFITFHLTVLSWVFFRSKGFSASIVYLSNMFSTSIYGLPLARIYLLEVFHWRYLPCLLCMLLFFWELKSVVSLRMWSVKISESFILC